MSKTGSRSKTLVLDGLFFVAGALIDAVAVNVFTAPNHIAPGGITGMGSMLNYLFQAPIGMGKMIITILIII